MSDTTGHAVPNATATVKSVATGNTSSAQTNGDRMCTIGDLVGGEYEVSAVAEELRASPIRVTLAASLTTDLTVSRSPGAVLGSTNPQTQQQDPNAPSLSDLGFSQQQMQANSPLQAHPSRALAGAPGPGVAIRGFIASRFRKWSPSDS